VSEQSSESLKSPADVAELPLNEDQGIHGMQMQAHDDDSEADRGEAFSEDSEENHEEDSSFGNESHGKDSRGNANQSAQAPGSRNAPQEEVRELSIQFPKSLFRKLTFMAQDEGVSIEDLAFELIAEGAVIRAWEIVEKKSTMRQGQSPQGNGPAAPNRYRQNQNRGPNNGNNQNRRNNNANRGRNPQNIHKLIEDKASFMEYVRNQEKKQR
jgi:hypothetical protein